MRSVFLLVLCVFLFINIPCQAIDISIVTPWNEPEIFGEDSWQVITARGFSNFFGREIGSWLGKIIQDNIELNQKRLRERIKEESPIDYLVLYEDWLHKLQDYKELEKEVKDSDDLTKIIEHIEQQKKSLEKAGKKINPVFDQYVEDLKHIRDYQKEIEEQEKEIQQLQTQAYITASMFALLILAQILALLAGVPV